MNQYQPHFLVLILISLCLHVFFYKLHGFLPIEQSNKKTDQSFQITLRHLIKETEIETNQTSPKAPIKPKKVKPKKIKPEQEPPIDPSLLIDNYKTGDTSGSSNQDVPDQKKIDFGAKQNSEKQKQAIKKTEVKTVQGVVTTTSETLSESASGLESDMELPDFYSEVLEHDEDLEGLDDITNNSLGESEQGIKSEKEIFLDDPVDLIPPELVNNLGNMKLLSDVDLDEAVVYDPYSKKRSKELKLVNGYLKSIMDQISKNWMNPLSQSQMKKGLLLVIRLEINMDGTLEDAWTFLQSGYPALDESFLTAIKAVVKFDTSAHSYIRNKYRYLNLTWSSTDKEYELMPFEAAPPT